MRNCDDPAGRGMQMDDVDKGLAIQMEYSIYVTVNIFSSA